MVDEARRVAFLRCVEDLIAVERHEVEVVARAVDLGTRPELSVLQHLTHVLNDEITPVDDTRFTLVRGRQNIDLDNERSTKW